MAARSEAPNTLLTFESSQRVCMHESYYTKERQGVEIRLLLRRRIDALDCESKRFVKQALAVSHTTNMQAIQ